MNRCLLYYSNTIAILAGKSCSKSYRLPFTCPGSTRIFGPKKLSRIFALGFCGFFALCAICGGRCILEHYSCQQTKVKLTAGLPMPLSIYGFQLWSFTGFFKYDVLSALKSIERVLIWFFTELGAYWAFFLLKY